MSTLTKILIILLTISSIFLCGIVVTYVANAESYKKKFDDLRVNNDSLNEQVKRKTEELKQGNLDLENLQKKLNDQIASLKKENAEVTNQLKTVQTKNDEFMHRLSSLESTVETANQTAKLQTELFEKAQKELEQVKSQLVKDNKKLDETTSLLIEKMAIIETLTTEKKRLLEEHAAIQQKLDDFLKPAGEKVIANPVTPEGAKAKPAPTPVPTVVLTEPVVLEGLITSINTKDSIAELSLGSVDGVKTGMKFYVTRGDRFICEIKVTSVDSEKSVGILGLVQQTPQVNDKISTNL